MITFVYFDECMSSGKYQTACLSLVGRLLRAPIECASTHDTTTVLITSGDTRQLIVVDFPRWMHLISVTPVTLTLLPPVVTRWVVVTLAVPLSWTRSSDMYDCCIPKSTIFVSCVIGAKSFVVPYLVSDRYGLKKDTSCMLQY